MDYIFLMQGQGEGGGGTQMLIMMALIVVVFYFFMIRPQMKKRKELVKFRGDLKQGDKILTIGGIHGKIADIKEDCIVIEVEEKMRLRIDKNAVIRDSSGMMAQK